MDEDMIGSWIADAGRAVSSLDVGAIARAVEALAQVRQRGGTIFVAGNGGSALTASHLALDLQKAARPDGRGTRAISLSDSIGLLTAWANDTSYERVFAEQFLVLAEPGDGLVIFSVSGSSPNLIALLEAARERGVLSVGLLGGDGGNALPLLTHAVVVRSPDYGWVESTHLVLEHIITYSLRGGPAVLGARA
jgi:D-sedoheptulose 7-phosphate isomerase